MLNDRDNTNDDEIRDLLREIRDEQRLLRVSQQEFFEGITELRIAVRNRLETQRASDSQAKKIALVLNLLITLAIGCMIGWAIAP